MIKKILKEIVYFIAILVILAFVMHSDLLTSPLERFTQMNIHENYLHPFFYSFIVYLIVVFFRTIAKFMIYIKRRLTK